MSSSEFNQRLSALLQAQMDSPNARPTPERPAQGFMPGLMVRLRAVMQRVKR